MQIRTVVKVKKGFSLPSPAELAMRREAGTAVFHRVSCNNVKIYSTTIFNHFITGPHPGSGARPS